MKIDHFTGEEIVLNWKLVKEVNHTRWYQCKNLRRGLILEHIVSKIAHSKQWLF